jgi:hypothetical protein
MKRFTLLLTVVFISIAAFGQSYDIDPQDYEKLQKIALEEREAAKAEINQPKKQTFVPQYTDATPSPSKGLDYAGEINLLILSPDTDGSEALRAALDAFDFINATSFPQANLPGIQLSDLTPYDVILTFNNNQWLSVGGVSPALVGDLLAEYLDEGGAFVENSYVMDWDAWQMQGAYITGGYSAFTQATSDLSGTFTLGTVHVPDHPIMTDVSAFATAGNSLVQNNGIAEGATRIADWNNGQVLFAVKDNVVSCNFLPMATGAINYTGDGTTFYANAVVWLMMNKADPEAPAAPTNLTATAGDMGALTAEISWTNPAETFAGDPLTDLTEVNVYRGGVLIHTVASPTIGGAQTYTDNDISAAGTYSYSVQGVNAAGGGPAAAVSVYIGEDVPAAPGDVTLVADGNDGFVTWTAPTEGLNGGYLSGDNLTYTVVRMPGSVEVAEDIAATEFLDTTVPGIGNYFYTVTASNAIGVGGSATSNVALLGAEGIFLYETFDYEIGTIPPGWFVEAELDPDGNNQGDGIVNWLVSNTTTAGGTAPQMRLTWNPRFEGMSRLVTNAIDVEGNEQVRLKFRQFLSNFAVVQNTLSVRVTFDGGETFETIWEHLITGSFPAQMAELYIDIPPDKSTFHIAWEFNGDAYQINNWDIDDVILEPVLENDLVALTISGNTTPSEGIENLYTINIQNAGTATQSNYNVKLMQEGDVELASVAGDPIEFGETMAYELAWTPPAGSAGPTYVYGYIDFVDDELPGNNQTGNLNVVVQPGDILAVTIGDGEVLTTQPYNFVWDYSIQQTLYYPEEIGLGGGVITGIQYVNSFNETKLDKNIMIWMGETDLEDLAGGWVDPSTLQLVFDGQVDFPEGVNNIFIPLDDLYVYGGGNLVIYNYKMDDEWSGSKNFFNTLDPNSNRTRGAQQDNTPYDPANPPAGTARSNFPNITMFFSTAGLGALEGTVTDGTDPVEGVLVRVLGTSSSRVTDENGFYEFSALLPDTYNVEFSKFGYETVVMEGVVIEEEVVTQLDVVVPVLDQFTVSGVVQGNDGELIEDAAVTMVGYDNYSAVTDASGAFTIADVYGGTYELTVMAPGYEVFVDEAVVVDADTDLGTIEVIEILFPPYGLTIETEGMEPGAALFTWNEIFEREFRYDDGIVAGQLGAGGGTLNTVLGSAHRNDAVLYEMSWWTTSEGGPHNTVKIWVFGLDANGNPDGQDVLFEMAGVTNVDNQWNTYEFPEPVEAPNGFLIGLSYAGFLGLGTDAGTSTEWPFMPNSNYFVFNYSTEAFAAIETLGDFPFNFLIRAFGADNGELDLKSGYADNTEGQSSDLVYSQLDKPFFTGYPQYSKPVMPADKVFTGFNVYLNDMDNPLITNHQSTSHMFTGLPGGAHTAGVQSVYTTGVSEIMTIDFEVEGPEFARAQIIHNSADAAVANVDLYVNGELVLPNVGFRQATPFIDIVAGVTLELHVAPAGADFEDAIGPIEVMFTPGETYVVIANGIVSDTGYDPAQPFGLYVFDQGQEAAGSGANTDLLVFHGATDAPEVSVWAMGVDNALFAFEYGEFAPNGYLPLPTNDYVIEIRDASGATTIVAYEAPLATLNLDGEALVVVASGFLNPDNNSGGPGFGLWVATTAGGNLIELPVYVSVQDITMGQGNISMFPNPSTDMVNLHSASTMKEVRVVDISGRVVYTQAIDADQHQINVRQFESGIYFVQVLTAEGTFVGKLQIQK